jgi:hypothetical protein
MLNYFKCSDKTIRTVKECITSCPRKEGRCLSLPTLYEISQQRPWTGRPSTTQLLKGVRQAFLELTKPYTIDPLDSAFMLLGTRHHQKLEHSAKLLGMISEKYIDAEITGILDLLEPDSLEPGKYILYDYKTSGSFAVAKALGLKKESDTKDWELQLNKYRVELENLGIPISRMIIQACVRDGGTFAARNNGIYEKFVLIPIRKMNNIEVSQYFRDKANLLITSMDTKILPPICSYEERWANRRCKGFCSVSEFCREGAAMAKIPFKE